MWDAAHPPATPPTEDCTWADITAKLHSNSRYLSALKDAEDESWDDPGVGVEVMIAYAHERQAGHRDRTPNPQRRVTP